MSTFAENPFFFFMDNVSASGNNSKNVGRIVELSDTGCDARLSVSSLLRNATRYYSSKSAKMRSNGNWRPRYEERFRGQYERNGINKEQLYFVPKEAEADHNHWQEYSAYKDRDFRMNSRITPDRIRQNTRYEHVSNNSTDHSQLPRFNQPRNNYGTYGQEAFYNRGRWSAGYPEDLKENPRNSNSQKDHWPRDNEDPYDKVSPDFSRYNSRKTTSSDRRKRTQPISEVFYENAESQYDIQTFQHSGSMTSNEGSRSTEKFKRFVDRAVDKDSLSDILDSNVSTESPVVKEEENKVRNTFWEFISLKDDDDTKTGRPTWPLKTKRDMKPAKRMDRKSIPNIPSNNEDANDNSKVGTSFMEKTVARLKRKLEKSKLEEPVSQSSTLPTEKKTKSEGSRLPVRIGGRLRSKNPIATRIRRNNTSGKEENKDRNGSDENSVRSRTKPKDKPSVLQSEVILGPSEAAEYSKSVGNVQEIAQIDRCSSRNEKGDENFGENEELVANVNDKVFGSSKLINVTGDQRRNGSGSAGGRKTSRRSNASKEMEVTTDGLKENCFFHLHDEENIVCNTRCKKDCRKSDCLESRKPAVIKTRL